MIHGIRYMTLKSILRNLYTGGFFVLGVTGPAGAGKTSRAAPLIQTMVRDEGLWSEILGLDSFFKRSSEDRARWLKEAETIGPEELARRRDQMNWWNFDRIEVALQTLKVGKTLHLTDIYNRADRGRLTGNVNLTPPSKGGVLVLDGVAIAHLSEVDALLYVHAPDEIRLERLVARDRHRGVDAAMERFTITQQFESEYFRNHWARIEYCADNSDSTMEADDLPIIGKPKRPFF